MPKLEQKTLKEKVWYKFSNFLIEFAEHLPNAKKGVISWLQFVRKERDIFSNELPSYLNVNLSAIWTSIVVPIEDFQDSIDSIVQMIDEYKSSRFLPIGNREKKELLSKLNNMKNGIYGDSWTNMGLLDFEKSKVNNFVDWVEFEIQSFSGNYVVITFQIRPAKEFKNKINRYLRRNFQEHVTIRPPKTFKSIFRGWWGSQMYPGDRHKLDTIQKEIVELKTNFSKEIKRFLKGYFLKKDDIIPSVELWTYSQTYCPINDDEKTKLRIFWESIGMREVYPECFETKNKEKKIYWPAKELNDLPLKLQIDITGKKVSSSFRNIENETIHNSNYWVPRLLSIWSFRIILLDINTDLTKIRFKLFQTLKQFWQQRLFKLSKKLITYEVILKRLSSLFEKDIYKQKLIRLYGLPNFESYSWDKKSKSVFIDGLLSNYRFLKSESKSFLKTNQEILEANIASKVLRSNSRTQFAILFLTFVMAVIMIYEKRSAAKDFLCDFKYIKTKPICLPPPTSSGNNP